MGSRRARSSSRCPRVLGASRGESCGDALSRRCFSIATQNAGRSVEHGMQDERGEGASTLLQQQVAVGFRMCSEQLRPAGGHVDDRMDRHLDLPSVAAKDAISDVIEHLVRGNAGDMSVRAGRLASPSPGWVTGALPPG